jgi:hypothetical protein
MALRPFFITSSTPSAISRLALHLTQYPSAISFLLPTLHAPDSKSSLTKVARQSNLEKVVTENWLNFNRLQLCSGLLDFENKSRQDRDCCRIIWQIGIRLEGIAHILMRGSFALKPCFGNITALAP